MHSRWCEPPFREAFPVAHLMRVAFPECWLRIHSLPESKRYAKTDAEREVVLERYARFGAALLGEHAPCLIIQSRFNGSRPRTELMPELAWAPIHRVVEDDEDGWDSWAAHTVWDPATFRLVLLAIADDEEAHIAFLSDVTDCVFIPYDGGADGFSFDTSVVKRLSETFAPWQSTHPLGL